MSLCEYMPMDFVQALMASNIDIEKCLEIRIRMNRPIIIKTYEGEMILSKEDSTAFIATKTFVENCYFLINEHSLYAHEDSIKQGYITIPGGHRAGFVGQAVTENDVVKTINNISSINIRIAHQVKGLSDEVIRSITSGQEVLSTLIISPPGYGKTTWLRDIVRNLSNGIGEFKGVDTCVIDERSEIAASHFGVPELDVGIRTDVFDNISKIKGMIMCLRTMSPKVIALDEIGSKEEMEQVSQIGKSGCSVIATIHAHSKEELINNENLAEYMSRMVFKKFIVLQKGGGYIVSD